jgi:cytidine deaminase
MTGQKYLDYADLNKSQQKLLDAAKKATRNAYSPYSKFRVGAALLTESGHIVAASNVENAAYGSTICAERSALVAANAMGYRSFKAIAVIAAGEKHGTNYPTAPCGACRQMLYEASQLSKGKMQVIFSNTNEDKIIVSDIETLLPFGFGPEDMAK